MTGFVDKETDVKTLFDDGYAEIRMPKHLATEFGIQAMERVRQLAMTAHLGQSAPGAPDFSAIHRLARMGHEAVSSGTVSSIDAEDLQALMGLKLSDRTAFLFASLNGMRAWALRSSGDVTAASDRHAKDLAQVLSS